MRYLFDLIWHFFSSNSRHGTHSPFVYKMADEVIYQPRDSKQLGESKVSKAAQLIQQIESQYPTYKSVIITEADLMNIEHILMLQQQYGFIFVIEPYKDRQQKENWQNILHHPDITVTIDLFHFGLIVPRKEQPKENFKLRFPYFKD